MRHTTPGRPVMHAHLSHILAAVIPDGDALPAARLLGHAAAALWRPVPLPPVHPAPAARERPAHVHLCDGLPGHGLVVHLLLPDVAPARFLAHPALLFGRLPCGLLGSRRTPRGPWLLPLQRPPQHRLAVEGRRQATLVARHEGGRRVGVCPGAYAYWRRLRA